MDKAIQDTIEKIKTLATKDAEFASEMRNLFGKMDSASSVSMIKEISDDVSFVRAILNIQAQNSINYDFVSNQLTKNQLIIDNLRMENYALDLESIDETERFYFFCVNAFYQIENIINYYYFYTYPDITELLSNIESHTLSSKYPFVRSGKELTVGDIVIEKKIIAFCDEFFPYSVESKDFTLKTLSELRQVRNEGLHRCDVIKTDKNEKLYAFFKYQNFNSIRGLLEKIVAKVKEELTNGI